MTLGGRLRAWSGRLDEQIDVRALAILRIALGPIVLLHLRPFLTGAAKGTIYRDHFYLPFWSWYPELPRAWYVALLWVTAGAAVLLSVGLFTRATAWLTAGGVAYNVLLSQTHFHHNRAFLIILLVGAAALPTGRAVSADAWRARRAGRPWTGRGGTRLALLVLRLEIAAVYLASGVSKLLDTDWWGGTVLLLRVEQHQARLADVGFPDWAFDLLTDPGFQSVASKAVVLTEIFIGAGLLIPATRKAAIWVAIPFHVAIQLTAAVQVFSFAALAALVVWVDGRSGARRAELSPGLARWTRALDWTGRFDVTSGDSAVVTEGPTVRRGAAARWFILSRLPLTFWFVAPIQLWRSLRAES